MRLCVDRCAVGPSGHQAVLQFSTGGKLVSHDPADYQEETDNPERDQRTALASILVVAVRHEMRSIIKRRQAIDTYGEPGGIRTHDPMIKSHVLYRLSYGLTWRINYL